MLCRSMHKPDTATPRPAATLGASFCQITGCTREVPPRHLMCREHWFEVPVELRNQVEESLAAWLGRKQDVRPYLIARLRALIHVCDLHNIDSSEHTAKLARWTKSVEASK